MFLGARSFDRGEAAAASLREDGLDVTFLQIDVSDPTGIEAAHKALAGHIDHLDALVNNAGILLDGEIGILDAPVDMAVSTFHTNSLGALWTTQTMLPLMGEGGRIVNMSSGGGEFCSGISTWAPLYCISKTTMNAITRQLDVALHPRGILINSMCPGWVRTEMGGDAASRSVSQGADTATWLVTDAPATHHGQFFRDREEISW